ncbi:hypothetical protein LZ31DRAFT_509183 [Colletotrichum somersetense]|nr:hypothetical protein LZ31DRAFT_509183 [Colletotrichum somersetense]
MTPEHNDLPPELNWNHDTRGNVCLQRTDWGALCKIASHSKDGVPCEPLECYTVGGSFLARLIHFQDGIRWVARVQLHEPTQETSERLRIELDTMFLLRSRTKAPVPQVFAFALDADLTGSAFVLLEYLPGNNAADQAHDYVRTDWGLVPPQNRPAFYRTMAAAQVQIASARLPKIGTVIRNNDGSFNVGPIPGLGGPFDTAESFICAWARKARFPYDEAFIRENVPTQFAEQIIEGIRQFPSRIAGLAMSGKQFTRAGPFPIRHPDLFHSNVIVTKAYNVIGVVDWQDSHTVPWELADLPLFLNPVPHLMNRPDQYDKTGWPLDKDEAGKWADEESYANLVRDAERDAGVDNNLSQILADRDSRYLAAVVHLFSQGKIGLYGKVLDYFEAK